MVECLAGVFDHGVALHISRRVFISHFTWHGDRNPAKSRLQERQQDGREREREVRRSEQQGQYMTITKNEGCFVWIISALQIAVLRLFQWLRA